MFGALRVFRAECQRLLHSWSAAFVALVLMLIPALRVFGARVAMAGESGEAGNAYAPLVDGWSSGLVLGALLILAYAARSLAADRAQGLLRLATTRSVSRPALVWGRALLGVPFCLAVLLLTGLGAGLAAALLFELGPLVEQGYELMSHEELQAELWKAVAASVPPLLALWAFGLAVSSASRSGSSALFVALASFMGFDLFKEVLGDAADFCFARFCPSLVDDSCMAEMSGVARGLSDAGFSQELYRMNLLLPIPQAVLLCGLAAWILSRRSL